MREKKYKICQLIIGGLMGAVIGFSIPQGNYILITIVLIIGLGLSYLTKKWTTEVLKDERTERITGRAGLRTVQIGLGIVALSGIFLMTFSHAGYIQLLEAGMALSFAGLTLLIIYIVFESYYKKNLEEVM